MECGILFYERNFVRTSVSGVLSTRGRSQGIQHSSNLSAREYAALTVTNSCTSSTPTSAEKLVRRNRNLTTRKNEGVREKTRFLRSAKKTARISKDLYPSRDIKKIIMHTHGILSPKRLLYFVEDVYQKKKAIDYAKEYTPDIPALITQIRSVIFQYNRGNWRSSIADRDIKILEDLCKRLDS